MPDPTPVELSIVMPCLNEADTLGTCLDKAFATIREHRLSAEVIVADNGSTDGSIEIAQDRGARVVHAAQRGYGNALMAGIDAARGQYVLMGDADDSYDFSEAPRFLNKLREGQDLVQGCRLPSGGGRILPGAMPPLHRWLGNPLLTRLARLMFRAPVHDAYCGLRAFRTDFYQSLGLRCTGMEFATEMIIKASLAQARFAEIPITLHPDGRVRHAPHLRTFRDGWRTLRLFLLHSPRWLFVAPGAACLLLGLLGYALALPGLRILGAIFDAHTLLVASLCLLIGAQSVCFGVMTKVFAVSEGFLPRHDLVESILTKVPLERAMLGCLGLMAIGATLIAAAAYDWFALGFGSLDYAHTMRRVIPGVTLVALGFQLLLSSWFVSVLLMGRR